MIDFYFFSCREHSRFLSRFGHWSFSRAIHYQSSQSLRFLSNSLASLRFDSDSLAGAQSLSLSLLQGYISCLVCPFWLGLGLLFLAWSWELLSLGQVVLITAGLTLGIYDFRHQEYPLLVWMTFHLILMAGSGWNLVMVFFLVLGIVAHFINIRMGAGDFLFLASCALVFSVTELLILIQSASATGILAFLLQKKKERLPFVPFLLLAACVIILVSYCLFDKVLKVGSPWWRLLQFSNQR